MNLPPAERILADAIDYLIRKGQSEAARVLLSCSMYVSEVTTFDDPDDFFDGSIDVRLTGPVEISDLLSSSRTPPHPLRSVIQEALMMSLPCFYDVGKMDVSPGANIFDPTWRNQLLEKTYQPAAQEPQVDNQGSDYGNKILTWNTLRFRSETERRIAAALEEAGVMFLPNCRVRLGPADNRVNREGDFLICHEGKWGILEVDGAPYHPPSRKAEEDERDRLFKLHGVRVVEHFDAKQCFETPAEVVKQFLAILKHS